MLPVLELTRLRASRVEALARMLSAIDRVGESLRFHPHPFARDYLDSLCDDRLQDLYYVLATSDAVIGYGLLRRRIGRLGLTRVFATLGRLGLAGLIAAVPTVIAVILLTIGWGDGKLASLVQLVVGAAVLLGAYVGAALWLRVNEVRELGAMVLGRLGR